MILYVPMNFPSVTALDKWGLHFGLSIGIILSTIGLWMRCLLINQNFLWAVIGQTIMAVGQPFIYNAPSLVSANWFPKKERIISTSIGAYANIFGIGIGCFVPAIFFNDDD